MSNRNRFTVATISWSSALVFAFAAQGGAAIAAEVKVFSTFATRAIMEDLVPKFEKASGHKVTSSIANTGGILKRIQGGDILDIVFTTEEGINRLVKDGKIAAGDVMPFARSGLGVAVRKGAPKPDISSPEALKRALLAAKSITYNDPASGGLSSSGIHITKMIERLGITKELKPKTVFANNDVGALVAAGKAELGVTTMSSLMPLTDIDVVGPLPGDLQANTLYSAAIPAGAKNAAAAKALVNFLRSAESAKVIKAKGMNPA